MIERYLFMRPVLDLLAQDRFMRRAASVLLKVAAALIVLFSLTVFFGAGRLLFDLSSNGILGGVLFEVCFVLGVYAAVHVLFIRASQIENLPVADYTVLRMAPLLVRALGEAYAGFVSLVAIGGGIFVWFTNLTLDKVLGSFVRALVPVVHDNPSFMGGIQFMVLGVLFAAGALIAAYLVAEALSLLSRSVRPQEVMRPAEERFRSRFGS